MTDPAIDPSQEDARQRPRRARRLPIFLLALIVTLVAGGFAMARWGHDDPPVVLVDGKPSPADSPTGKAASGGAVGGQAYTAKLLGGLEQDELTIGDAPITVVEFIDLQCPYCAEHQLNIVPAAVGSLVRTGRARLSLLPLAFLGPDSEKARTVFFKLAEQDLGWQFADLMFRNQGPENTGYVTAEYLSALVAAIPGADPADADPTPSDYSRRASAYADAFGKSGAVDGTPSFLVGRTGAPVGSYVSVGADWDAALAAIAELERAPGDQPGCSVDPGPGPDTAPHGGPDRGPDRGPALPPDEEPDTVQPVPPRAI